MSVSSTSRTSSTSVTARESSIPTVHSEHLPQRQAVRSEPDLPHSLQWPSRSSSNQDPSRYRRRPDFPNAFQNELPPLPFSEMSPESRRQNLVAMDRKRRLTGSLSETGRRRTVSGGYRNREDQYYGNSAAPAIQGDTMDGVRGMDRPIPAEVIDLTSSPQSPPSGLPAPPRRTSSHGSRMYVVPRWQPDSDVSECPICHRPFGILFRRHHCRKCGRVVCNDCSPHRITIPRQFIVHPPNAMPTSPTQTAPDTIDLTREDTDSSTVGSAEYQARPLSLNPALGGGEKVRLCNPCVPDPQPDPQPNYIPPFNRLAASHTSIVSRPSTNVVQPRGLSSPLLYQERRRQPSGHSFPHPGIRVEIDDEEDNDDDGDDSGSSSEIYTLPRRVMVRDAPMPDVRSSSFRQNVLGHHRYGAHSSMHSRYHSTGATRPPLPPPSPPGSLPYGNRPRVRSMLDPLPYHSQNISRSMAAGSLPNSSSSSSSSRPLRPRVREEDICPICRRELPAKDLNGDETARENHVMQCIALHDASSITATTRNRSQSQTESPASQIPATLGEGAPSASSLVHRAPMQMLRFTATEKDCLGEDGSVQECSICMIEYNVGDRLVRLECWCKFHDECIVEWFARKRECPVHKIA